MKILYSLFPLSPFSRVWCSSNINRHTLESWELWAFDPGFYKHSMQHPLYALHTSEWRDVSASQKGNKVNLHFYATESLPINMAKAYVTCMLSTTLRWLKCLVLGSWNVQSGSKWVGHILLFCLGKTNWQTTTSSGSPKEHAHVCTLVPNTWAECWKHCGDLISGKVCQPTDLACWVQWSERSEGKEG